MLLFKYDKNPIFVIGLDKGTYKTAADESRKDKDLLQTILEDIKEKISTNMAEQMIYSY